MMRHLQLARYEHTLAAMKEEFKVGDTVKFQVSSGFQSSTVVGRVTVISKSKVLTVAGNSGGTYEFRNRKSRGYGCSRLTPHEVATLAWRRRLPKPVHCEYKWPWVRDDFDGPEGIRVDTGTDPETLTTVFKEIAALRNWLLEKPTDDPEVSAEHEANDRG